jgi:hypothetical protein
VGLGLGNQAASSALYLVEVSDADAGADQLLPRQDQRVHREDTARVLGDRPNENGTSAGAGSSHGFGDRVANRLNVVAVDG